MDSLTRVDLTADVIAAAAENAADTIAEINDDLHASAEYRAAMTRVFAGRAISAAAGI